jgi:BlaI family penicillinase repressor
VAIPYLDYRSFVLSNFINTYFNNSGAELVEYLVDQKLIENSKLKDFLGSKTSEVITDQEIKDPVKQFVERNYIGQKTEEKGKKER